jgi:hypothetical protein
MISAEDSSRERLPSLQRKASKKHNKNEELLEGRNSPSSATSPSGRTSPTSRQPPPPLHVNTNLHRGPTTKKTVQSATSSRLPTIVSSSMGKSSLSPSRASSPGHVSSHSPVPPAAVYTSRAGSPTSPSKKISSAVSTIMAKNIAEEKLSDIKYQIASEMFSTDWMTRYKKNSTLIPHTPYNDLSFQALTKDGPTRALHAALSVGTTSRFPYQLSMGCIQSLPLPNSISETYINSNSPLLLQLRVSLFDIESNSFFGKTWIDPVEFDLRDPSARNGTVTWGEDSTIASTLKKAANSPIKKPLFSSKKKSANQDDKIKSRKNTKTKKSDQVNVKRSSIQTRDISKNQRSSSESEDSSSVSDSDYSENSSEHNLKKKRNSKSKESKSSSSDHDSESESNSSYSEDRKENDVEDEDDDDENSDEDEDDDDDDDDEEEEEEEDDDDDERTPTDRNLFGSIRKQQNLALAENDRRRISVNLSNEVRNL